MGGAQDGNDPETRTPETLREGVRLGIRDALAVDLDPTSQHTARRLGVAGVLGLGATVGALVLFSGDSLHADHGWHLALCAAAWAGLLVECFALVLLRVQHRKLPLAHAAALALLGFGLAAVLGLLCPNPEYLEWWAATALGGLASHHGGAVLSALCLGLCSALLIGTGAALILALHGARLESAPTPALLLFLLLWPAVVLQCTGAPVAVFAAWTLGLGAGAYGGVGLGLGAVRPSPPS